MSTLNRVRMMATCTCRSRMNCEVGQSSRSLSPEIGELAAPARPVSTGCSCSSPSWRWGVLGEGGQIRTCHDGEFIWWADSIRREPCALTVPFSLIVSSDLHSHAMLSVVNLTRWSSLTTACATRSFTKSCRVVKGSWLRAHVICKELVGLLLDRVRTLANTLHQST